MAGSLRQRKQHSGGLTRHARGRCNKDSLEDNSRLQSLPQIVQQQLVQALPDVATILDAGVQCVLLSLGASGCALCLPESAGTGTLLQLAHQAHQCSQRATEGAAGHASMQQTVSGTRQHQVHAAYIPAVPCNVVNANGAGDCLFAGMLAALLRGWSLLDAACAGAVAASHACCSPSNVPPDGLQAVLQGSPGNAAVQGLQRRVVQLTWQG